MFECDCPLDGLSVEVLSFQSSHFIIQWRGQTSPVATGFFLEINLLLEGRQYKIFLSGYQKSV